MTLLKITDSTTPGYTAIDFFYPTPKSLQDLGRTLFQDILGKEFQLTTLEGLFESTLNRHLFVELKVGEHAQIAKNIINHCKSNDILQVECLLHKSNRALMSYYLEVFSKEGIELHPKFHKEKLYWENSLTKKSNGIIIKTKIFLVFFVQLILISLNALRSKSNLPKDKRIVFWNSFANNREEIDFPFLDQLEKDVQNLVIHPNPYLIFSKANWNKSLYWMKDLSVSPLEFCKFLQLTINFKKKFNHLLNKYEPKLGKLPTSWNIESLSKVLFFLEYNFLLGGLAKKLSEKKQNRILNIYRGGAAAGLIYSGYYKKRHAASHLTNILVTHGTEFSPIDHFSYFFTDYYILPSQPIIEDWNTVLKNQYSKLLQFNQCTLIAGGRIDYDYLLSTVVPKEANFLNKAEDLSIGIVLTYNSDNYQYEYISQIVDSFKKTYPNDRLKFVVKPRPNLRLHPSLKNDKQIQIHNGDIVTFLNSCNLVIGTLSTYGVLSMVVTDSIFCNIPALYFIPSKGISAEDLGYSYHPSMKKYCFYNKEQLENTLSLSKSISELLIQITESNTETRRILNFDGKAVTFLERFISKQCL